MNLSTMHRVKSMLINYFGFPVLNDVVAIKGVILNRIFYLQRQANERSTLCNGFDI